VEDQHSTSAPRPAAAQLVSVWVAEPVVVRAEDLKPMVQSIHLMMYLPARDEVTRIEQGC
jgi:hypothetical protein